ncbi:phage late control D family protein [Methylocystis heyeri]|uniref:Late control protein n=1 Tax=Methylocystis heyeri TaxID=391905 RepID=A0A6B8KJK1_9HYPH|nr:contractile injection system protein, VgrG/Pvc8 family [Methylocystis heyeri]QGM46753.1 hypothetical protein H2LOC_014205 [Methylocystis heyeri]
MIPVVTVSIDGNPLTQVRKRAISGAIIESDGEKADSLNLEISNYDGRLKKPTRGQTVVVAVGWEEIGTVKVGQFIISTVSKKGPEAVFHVTGEAADLKKTLKGQKTRSWTAPKTLGDVFKQVAKDNGLSAAVDQTIASIKIEKIVAQTAESDMHLVTRLARHYGALATVKDGNLVVVPLGNGTTASGGAAASCQITPNDCESFSFDENDRNARDKSHGTHYDRSKAKRSDVASQKGQPQDGAPDFTHVHLFGTQTEAQNHADGRKQKFDRDSRQAHFALRPGLTGVPPGGVVNASGFGDDDDTAWTVKSREFRWNKEGLAVTTTAQPQQG